MPSYSMGPLRLSRLRPVLRFGNIQLFIRLQTRGISQFKRIPIASLQPRSAFRPYPTSTSAALDMEPAANTKMNSSTILKDVYKFWFSHVQQDENLTLSTMNDNKIWFRRDANFDQKCLYVLFLV